MPRKSVGRNYIYNLLYEVLTVLVPLVTTPYISRVLGAENIGIYSYTNSIATYFALFAALGTTVYGRREIAYKQDDLEGRSVVFFEITLFRILMTILSVFVYLPYCLSSDYGKISLIQGLYVVTVAFDITWFFQGMENFGIVVLRNSIIKILNIAFIFLLVKSENDLDIYILGLLFLPFIGNLVMWPNLKGLVKKVPLNYLHPFSHFRGAIALFIPTIASQVYLVLDKTMLGLFMESKVENGFYEQAQKIVRICWTFVTTFSLVMAPRIAYAFAQKKDDLLQDYMKKSFSAVWFVASPIAFGLAALADNLVPWFFGEEFLSVSGLLFIFSWIVFPIGLHSVIGAQYLISIKKQNPYTVSVFVGAAVNFVLNMFFIQWWGAKGAAIASVIAEVCILAVQTIYVSIILRTISVRIIFGTAFKYIFSGVTMFFVVYMMGQNMSPMWYSSFLLMLVGAISYLTVLVLLKDPMCFSLWAKVKNKVVR